MIRLFERECCIPGCTGWLSAEVPERVTMCGNHQLVGVMMLQRYPELRQDGSDIRCTEFLVSHEELGGSGLPDLAKFWRIPEGTLKGYVLRGVVKASRVANWNKCPGRNDYIWFVKMDEIVRVYVLLRDYIPVRDLAQESGVAHDTIISWLINGLLKGAGRTLRGGWAVKRQFNLAEKVTALRDRQVRSRRVTKHYVGPGELKLSTAAHLLGVSIEALNRRKSLGEIKVTAKGRRLVTTWVWFADFLLKVRDGKLNAYTKVKIRAGELLSTHPNLKRFRHGIPAETPAVH